MVSCGKITVETACNICADFVPEGESERIRKSLSTYFAKFNPNDMWDDDFSFGDIVAWFEKQGQTFTKKDVDDAYLKGVCDTKQELEKQGGQKPTEWSEEDEGFRNLLIAIMKVEHPEGMFEANGITPFCGAVSVHRVIDWLKSLKDKYTWKPTEEQMGCT